MEFGDLRFKVVKVETAGQEVIAAAGNLARVRCVCVTVAVGRARVEARRLYYREEWCTGRLIGVAWAKKTSRSIDHPQNHSRSI
jgi:hypothetical protein